MKKSTKKVFRNVLISILILLLIAGGLGYGVIKSYLDKIGKIDTDIDIIDPSDVVIDPDIDEDEIPEGSITEDPNKPEDNKTDNNTGYVDPGYTVIPGYEGEYKPSSGQWTNVGVEIINSSKRLNILLVGQDRRPGEGRQRSDAMILASIDPNNGRVDLISFMRDTFVYLPWGYNADKLNAAYCYGGFPLLKQTIFDNFGVKIDGCFEVDFNGFKTCIDAVGGVDIWLSDAEAWHLYSKGYSQINSGAGTYHMNGNTALEYSRIRSIDNDFFRTDRQKNVINALINKVRGMGVGDLISVANSLLPYLATDMDNGSILSLISKCAPMLSGGVYVTQCHAPDWGEFEEGFYGPMYVLYPNRAWVNYRLRNLIGD